MLLSCPVSLGVTFNLFPRGRDHCDNKLCRFQTASIPLILFARNYKN